MFVMPDDVEFYYYIENFSMPLGADNLDIFFIFCLKTISTSIVFHMYVVNYIVIIVFYNDDEVLDIVVVDLFFGLYFFLFSKYGILV